MSFATDTDDLLGSAAGHGESIVIRRNTPTYGATGTPTDVWATVATVNADVQQWSRTPGENHTVELGQNKFADLWLIMPDATDVRQGDRLRRAGWSTGDDELEVNGVITEEGHVEVVCSVVKGHG